MKVFSIAGWSGSGKTTLICRLIAGFKEKGQRVIAVKKVPYKYYLEPESADSFKFLEAGADDVCLVAAQELMTMKRISEKEQVFQYLDTRSADCDLLLLEGLRNPGIPLIEVYNSSLQKPFKFPSEKVIAIVSDIPVTQSIPNFNRDQIPEIIHFMEVYHG